jgi:hypothetical protein
MFFKSRFIHFQSTLPGDKYHGFSVRLSPSYDPSLVDFQYTLCSKKDQFSRSKARDVLYNKEVLSIPVKSLPATLAALEYKTYGVQHIYANDCSWAMSNRWTWVWKYFL